MKSSATLLILVVIAMFVLNMEAKATEDVIDSPLSDASLKTGDLDIEGTRRRQYNTHRVTIRTIGQLAIMLVSRL
jgi:hypothetical protein